jgi:hypothetical protein
MRRWSWVILIIAVTFLMLRITFPYFSFKYDIGFLLTKQAVLHITLWRIAFYTHISSSLFVLLAGGIQFFKNNSSPRFHRITGTIYVLMILIVSAPSGLVMAFYANGGVAAKVSFVIVSLLWWIFTFKAYRSAKAKQWKLHRAEILRSYALTFSAITLRTYVMLLPFIIHLSAKDAYTLVSYLSWIPNLLVAEFIIRKTNLFYSLVRMSELK